MEVALYNAVLAKANISRNGQCAVEFVNTVDLIKGLLELSQMRGETWQIWSRSVKREEEMFDILLAFV